LIWNAQNLQAEHNHSDDGKGIGIFRNGFEKGMPSFYIGRFIDNAGLLETKS
jgi:hypothetical protein